MDVPSDKEAALQRKLEARRKAVVAAVEQELLEAKRPTTFNVVQSRRVVGAGGLIVWELDLDQATDKFALDEAMEGARAWWPEPTKGSGEVLVVQAEHGRISLVNCTSEPPRKDGVVKVYPKPYLEGLRDLWRSPSVGVSAARRLGFARSPKLLEQVRLPMDAFDLGTARRGQRDASSLLGYRVGYLWGPPGTGKTTTVGMMLASALTFLPDCRILLLSTTNAAVDQALESVDKSLQRLARTHGAAAIVRRDACHRFGRRFLTDIYKERPHLLPSLDRALLNELIEHEAGKPPAEDTPGLAAWNQRRDELRLQIAANKKAALLSSRLVAMTTTGATFSHETLREAGQFDWVVFDEGSQVSQAHFGALATLGRRMLVAGDPQQLGPVVLSDSPEVQRWLGHSPFDLRDEALTAGMVFLDEQSRMAKPICDLVSNVFYRGRLRLAEATEADRLWRTHRQIHNVPTLGGERLNLLRVSEDGGWSAAWKGPIRVQSAQMIANVCKELRAARCDDIVVLTPFRAQRALLKVTLERAGVRGVDVWTVHRAQGSEHHTVFFDPVMGGTKFLCTPEARRLLNVALSRAKARVVVTMSVGDELNPTLRDIACMLRGEELSHMRGFLPIHEVMRAIKAIDDLVGRKVVIGDYEGNVLTVSGKYVRLRLANNLEKEFDLEVLAGTAAGL